MGVQRTKTALQSEIDNLLPDNTAQEVSPADHRSVSGDIKESALFLKDAALGSGGTATDRQAIVWDAGGSHWEPISLSDGDIDTTLTATIDMAGTLLKRGKITLTANTNLVLNNMLDGAKLILAVTPENYVLTPPVGTDYLYGSTDYNVEYSLTIEKVGASNYFASIHYYGYQKGLVYRQDASSGLWFLSFSDLGLRNGGSANPATEDIFSVLTNLENYRDNEGKFNFRLEYPNLSGGTTYEWTQTSNPYTSAQQTVTGFTHISPGSPAANWGGLSPIGDSQPSANALIDGQPGLTDYYFAIGATGQFLGSNVIPATTGNTTDVVELYID